MDMEYEGALVQKPRSWLEQLDWTGVRQEVEMEARAEIVLLGPGNAGKSTLFNSLRGWPVTLTALKVGRVEQVVEEPMGLFTLIDLPEDSRLDDGLLERLERATLLVYLLDGAVGCTPGQSPESVVRPADSRWVSRLRATGRPLLVVLNKADLWDGRAEDALTLIEHRLGTEATPISAYAPPDAQCSFLERMVEVCPDLAVPLGQEVAAFRRAAVRRLTRRAALLCGLVAMEPIPLIDLPMQVGAQVGLVARIAAIYGHPPSSDYSKELVLTGAGSVAFRLLGQQAAKAVPLLGWVVSGLLGAATTWLVGQATLAYFEGYATPDGIGRLLAGLWRERAWPLGGVRSEQSRTAQGRPWCGRAVGALLRFCPAVWVLRWGRGLWKRRTAEREDVKDVKREDVKREDVKREDGLCNARYETRIMEVGDELVETEARSEEGEREGTGGAGALLARGATACLADRAPQWSHTRRGPSDGTPVRAKPGEEPGAVAEGIGERRL